MTPVHYLKSHVRHWKHVMGFAVLFFSSGQTDRHQTSGVWRWANANRNTFCIMNTFSKLATEVRWLRGDPECRMNTWTEHVHPNVSKHIWLHEKLNSITPAEVAPALTSHTGRRKQTHFSRSINRPSFSGPHVCWRGCGRINQRGELPPPTSEAL